MDPVIQKRVDLFEDPARRVGATYVPGEGVHVRVFAPEKTQVEIQWTDGVTKVLQAAEDGYYTGLFPQAKPGDRYAFIVNGRTLPDPASRYQPHGVHGPSEVVAQDFAWTDKDWRGVPFDEWVIYEIHVGTYSSRGDFEGVISDLPRLRDLGVTTIEIMPVSPFSGARNWGYDGVFPHAVQNSYGGPRGLKTLVDACHAHGLCIILDVVYNHLGPEGNVLPFFGPYFQSTYKTPWGDALNFDGPQSEHVRNYFLQTVWQWLTEYRFDGLRLDAVHAILDTSPLPFLEELSRLKAAAEKVRGIPLTVIAETDRNDSRMLAKPEENGLGFDAQWADDLHHALHVMLTGENGGYYADYGGIEQLWRTYRDGVAFQGEYSFTRGRCHGRSYAGVDKKRLVVQTQNHDQIGNRINGRRLNALVGFEKIRLDAAAIFLTPFTPLFFMGEELNLDTPFHYFVSHEDKNLLALVREGRNNEFNLAMEENDPGAEELFTESTLPDDKSVDEGTESGAVLRLFRDLIGHSKKLRQFNGYGAAHDAAQMQIVLSYRSAEAEMRVILSFSENETAHELPEGIWTVLLDLDDYAPGRSPRERSAEGQLDLPPFAGMLLRKGVTG